MAWVQQKFPKGIEYDCFDVVVNFLFDDTDLAENPEDYIGYCLRNRQEAELLKRVTKSLDRLLAKLGNELSDLEDISSPLWLEVIQTATIAYDFFTDENSKAIEQLGIFEDED